MRDVHVRRGGLNTPNYALLFADTDENAAGQVVTRLKSMKVPYSLDEVSRAIRDSEDLVNVGAYVQGTNPRIDQARSKLDAIERFLCHEADTLCRFSDTVESLTTL